MRIISLLIKLGRAPFHYWVPLIREGINWYIFYLLVTWQKIGPLLIIYLINNYNYLIIFILLSSIIGSIIGLNNSSIKKILSFSSINQISWIISALILTNKIWNIYIIIYFYLILTIIYRINFFNIKKINEIYLLNNLKNKFSLIFIFINLLSLGGLPPFLGFFPKIIIIFKLNNNFLILFLILFTLIALFFYFRIIYSIFIFNSIKLNILLNIKNNKKFNKNIIIAIFNNLIIFIIFILY